MLFINVIHYFFWPIILVLFITFLELLIVNIIHYFFRPLIDNIIHYFVALISKGLSLSKKNPT